MKGDTDVIKIVIGVALLLVVVAVLFQIFNSQMSQGERTLDGQQEGASRQICQQNCNLYDTTGDDMNKGFYEVYPECEPYKEMVSC